MSAMMMLQVAIVLLLIAAAGGLVMAAIRFSRDANPPAWLAMLHGLLAGGAATLLLYAALVAGLPAMANLGIVLLLGAAGARCVPESGLPMAPAVAAYRPGAVARIGGRCWGAAAVVGSVCALVLSRDERAAS